MPLFHKSRFTGWNSPCCTTIYNYYNAVIMYMSNCILWAVSSCEFVRTDDVDAACCSSDQNSTWNYHWPQETEHSCTATSLQECVGWPADCEHMLHKAWFFASVRTPNSALGNKLAGSCRYNAKDTKFMIKF